MKDLQFSALLELYGKALTDKQYNMAEQYYHFDYSLAEIAENEGVSRQAVYASLHQTKHTLYGLEQKLGFYQKMQLIRAELAKAAQTREAAAMRDALDRIEEVL